ncbi:sensor histidine kinase [Marinitenerispora sediminis]|uniref:histidine kinase n=2 Tax=Marinitenerispora sediminis TaxID=1931232 RepID=A0A368SZT6_9ACTN|nr:sensor histidine kinase [Marinitenerispora sediminis]RCV49360.1 sensor histidine kinase [Marinitenerispora sediminis]RCV51949.1 sensor histidine kinase [Marinitenerispora sediminis]
MVAAGIGLPLALRRRWPLPVFGVVLGMSAAGLFLGTAHDAFVAAAWALYTVAHTRVRVRWGLSTAVGALSAVGLFGATATGVPATRGTEPAWWGGEAVAVLLGAVLLGGAWTVGSAVRARRDYAAWSAARLARQAVTEERLRIARELHDIVAHSMGVIAVTAGVANHVLKERPEEAGAALRTIEETSRGALTETRRLLGVLRTEGAFQEAAADRVPHPGPADLPALVAPAEAAGVRVDLRVTGAGRLPEALGLSVYQIVREALANVVRHAAPTRCQVTVSGSARDVRITVVDTGPPPRPGRERAAGGGHGIIGMRERAAAFGGSFAAGPRKGGGFAVEVRLPYVTGGGVRA